MGCELGLSYAGATRTSGSQVPLTAGHVQANVFRYDDKSISEIDCLITIFLHFIGSLRLTNASVATLVSRLSSIRFHNYSLII